MPPGRVLGWCIILLAAGQAQAQIALDRPRHLAPVLHLVDGFDFPVGKPDGRGYYKARGFRADSHPGEDWDGVGGGNTDYNDPVNSIADGAVTFVGDARSGWGNVVIVRHQFKEGGELKTVEALFGHLHAILVRPGEIVRRGQQIGTIGTAHGQYDAHLHFEIRKNLAIGTNRSAYPADLRCYYNPSLFIAAHRPAAVSEVSNDETRLGLSRELRSPVNRDRPEPLSRPGVLFY